MQFVFNNKEPEVIHTSVKEENKLCIHEWHLNDFEIEKNFGCSEELKEIYTVACSKCSVYKRMSKYEYKRFAEVFPKIEHRCNVKGHDYEEVELVSLCGSNYVKKQCKNCHHIDDEVVFR